jgi:hypothetical protein
MRVASHHNSTQRPLIVHCSYNDANGLVPTSHSLLIAGRGVDAGVVGGDRIGGAPPPIRVNI